MTGVPSVSLNLQFNWLLINKFPLMQVAHAWLSSASTLAVLDFGNFISTRAVPLAVASM
jgi:hypothetical protein